MLSHLIFYRLISTLFENSYIMGLICIILKIYLEDHLTSHFSMINQQL
jgi:hypothetical protein